MASINLKNKSKADLVALVRLSGIMPISRAQRMTKAELISQLELLQGELNQNSETQSTKKDPREEEDVLLHSAPGRLAARQHNSSSKQSQSVTTERRSVLVAPDEADTSTDSRTNRRSIMAIPEIAPESNEETVVEAKKSVRGTRSAMLAPEDLAPADSGESVKSVEQEDVVKKSSTRGRKRTAINEVSVPAEESAASTTDNKVSDNVSESAVVKTDTEQATKPKAARQNKPTAEAETKTPAKAEAKTPAKAEAKTPAKRGRKSAANKKPETIETVTSSPEQLTIETVSETPSDTRSDDNQAKKHPADTEQTADSTQSHTPKHTTTRKKRNTTTDAKTVDKTNSTATRESVSAEAEPKSTIKKDETTVKEEQHKTASVTEASSSDNRNDQSHDQRQNRQNRNKTRNQVQQRQGRQLRPSSNLRSDELGRDQAEHHQEVRENDEPKTDSQSKERRPIDSGEVVSGVMEIMPDGYGFLRRDNYLQGPKDIYIPPQFIRRFNLREGDLVSGPTRVQRDQDRYQALYYINAVNGLPPEQMTRRPHFDRLTPIYPNERFTLETTKQELSTRIIDLISPIGKGQRGMIVSPPKAGKTILLQKIANAISINNPEAKLIVLLIDERPEEVTDMQRSINGEVIYSTFDKSPENHVKITELVLERAMRLVEIGEDVIILMDSLTRMARAYNLTINPTGRTLSGGLDPGALYGPKRFFGAARNIENGGSLTIVATALIDTGSRMDEVIFEEFKGTGNMEVYLDRKLSEKRIFPAIDINKSSTRREELLLSEQELEAVWSIRKGFGSLDSSNVTETIMNLLMKTNDNRHFVSSINVSLNNKSLYDSMKPSLSKNNN